MLLERGPNLMFATDGGLSVITRTKTSCVRKTTFSKRGGGDSDAEWGGLVAIFEDWRIGKGSSSLTLISASLVKSSHSSYLGFWGGGKFRCGFGRCGLVCAWGFGVPVCQAAGSLRVLFR